MNVPTRNSISARSVKMLSAALVALAVPAFPQSPNQILSAGYSPPSYQPVAVGQVITLFVPAIDAPDASSAQIPPPTSLSGVSVAVRVAPPAQPLNNYYPPALGILRIYTEKSCFLFSPCPNTQITVQVPTDRVCIMGASSTGCRGPEGPPPQIILNVKANGATGPDHSIQVSDSIPHLLNSCDSIFGPPSGSCYSLITHADGALVNNSNPAKVGEVITAWAVGLGQGSTQVRFQYRLASDDPTALATYFTVGHLILPEWVGPTPGYLGLYQINFKVPSMPAATFQCAGTTQNNALIDITTNFTQAVSLCVQP